MQTLSWRNGLYAHLLRESQRGTVQRHCAYMAAGWLSLFMIRPELKENQPAGLGAVAGGAALLVMGLVLMGPTLNLLQPVLRLAGKAPGLCWVAAAAAGVMGWRYAAGRKLLLAFAASNPLL